MVNQVAEPLLGEAPPRARCSGKALALLSSLTVLAGAAVCLGGAGGQMWAVPEPAATMAWQPLKVQVANAFAHAETSAAAALRRPSAVAPQAYASAFRFA